MTTNQIAYWANQEAARANRAREAENYRHNLAAEQENVRSAMAKEAETSKHNRATEAETARFNRDTITMKKYDTAIKAVDTTWRNINDSARVATQGVANLVSAAFKAK